VEREGESGRIGNRMLEDVERMFTWWHRGRDGTLARTSFRVYMRTVQRRFEALLAEGAKDSHPKTSKTCVMRLKRRDARWTLVYFEGVERRTMAPSR